MTMVSPASTIDRRESRVLADGVDLGRLKIDSLVRVKPRPPGCRRRALRVLRAGVQIVTALALLATITSCGSEVTPKVSYKPVLLPIKINVDPNGVSVEGDTSIVTSIGVFSVGAQYSLPKRDEQTIYVIVRDRRKGDIGYDQIYAVRTGKESFSAVVNGTTGIEVHDGQVIIDVTDGTVRTVEFTRSGPAVSEQSGGNPLTRTQQKWNTGYESSWYQPFMLSSWAYDDSTIARWLGVGFVWFLVRLVLAIVLVPVDLVLSVVFLVAQAAYLAGDSTGRNVVWGIFVLFLLVLLGAWMATA